MTAMSWWIFMLLQLIKQTKVSSAQQMDFGQSRAAGCPADVRLELMGRQDKDKCCECCHLMSWREVMAPETVSMSVKTVNTSLMLTWWWRSASPLWLTEGQRIHHWTCGFYFNIHLNHLTRRSLGNCWDSEQLKLINLEGAQCTCQHLCTAAATPALSEVTWSKDMWVCVVLGIEQKTRCCSFTLGSHHFPNLHQFFAQTFQSDEDQSLVIHVILLWGTTCMFNKDTVT